MILTPKLFALLNAMQSLQAVLPAKAIRQCTRHFLFDCVEKGVQVSASDVDIFVRLDVEARHEKGESVLIPSTLIGLLKDRALDEFTILTEKNVATVNIEGGNFTMPLCADVADFPEPKNPDDIKARCSVNAAAFAAALRRALMAAPVEQGRYNLPAICIRLANKTLHVVSTDGGQLMLTRLKTGRTEDEAGELASYRNMLPLKSAEVLAKMCEGMPNDADVEIGVGNGGIFCVREGFYFSSLMVTGQEYHKYETFTKDDGDKELIVAADALRQALTIADGFIGEETKAIEVTLDGSEMTIKAADATKGKSLQKIECDFQGDEFKFQAKSDFLRNACKITKGEHVRMTMSTPQKAIFIHEGADVTYLFMPINKA